MALGSEAVKRHIAENQIREVVYVEGRLINFVLEA
jgi:hypothetical protein